MAYDDTRIWSVTLIVLAMQTANTDDLLFQLPTGYAGVFQSSNVFLTTGVATAAAVFTLGTEADDTTYGGISVPIASANAAPNVEIPSVNFSIKKSTGLR